MTPGCRANNSSNQIQPVAGQLDWHECKVTLEGDKREYTAECGRIFVSENRSKSNSKLIALPVTRVKALTKGTHEAPIFWFDGGPGSHNWMTYPTDGLLQQHDIIIVGYRGIDGDQPLSCPHIRQAMSNLPDSPLAKTSLEHLRNATHECARYLTNQGVDIAGYTMSQTIEDFEQVRQSLGFDQIKLFGNSYGTRLQLMYLWRHPQRVDRAVLVAANPPGHFVWHGKNTDSLLKRYTMLCKQDPDCSRRTSDLMQTMSDLVADPPRSWMGIDIDMATIRLITFFSLMESSDTVNLLNGPAALDIWLSAANNNPAPMATASLVSNWILSKSMNWEHFIAIGGSAPDYHLLDRGALKETQQGVLGAPFTQLLYSMTQGWPVTDDKSPTESQFSKVPVLFISGELDGSTPPINTQTRLLPHFPQSQHVILKNIAHTESFWSTQASARKRLLNSFFLEGTANAGFYIPEPINFKPAIRWAQLMWLGIVVSSTIAILIIFYLIVFVVSNNRNGKPFARQLGKSQHKE
jgi:pimeloyl-ACP methyl ester carboxylesterase